MNIKIENKEGLFYFDNQSFLRSSFEPIWISEILGKDPKIIFEFGSRDGGDGLRLKQFFQNAQVYSFEPDPFLFEKTKQIEKYGINVYNYAISNIIGKVDFYRVKDKDTNCYMEAGSILKATLGQKKTMSHLLYEDSPIKVDSITIHQFCLEHNIVDIDFMQIDVEGATNKVISGFGSIKPKIIFAELQSTIDSHNESSQIEEVMNVLALKNYELIGTNGSDSLFRLK